MSAKGETFSVRLPEATKRQIEAYARAIRRSRSFVVQEAVEEFIRDRAAYLADLEAAMADVESGVGHSADQVFDWMRTWGGPEKAPKPKPDIGG